MSDSRTRLDKINARIRNNPVLSLLIAVSTVVIGLSTFTSATRNLMELFSSAEQRPAINGLWQAQVSYDWPNADYQESFNFAGSDKQLYGSASFTRSVNGILEGEVVADTVHFIIKTPESSGSEPIREAIHRYQGKIVGDEIKFVMQTEGSYSAHVPIEFTAKRSSNPAVQPAPTPN